MSAGAGAFGATSNETLVRDYQGESALSTGEDSGFPWGKP
jgi:hypothetical protein